MNKNLPRIGLRTAIAAACAASLGPAFAQTSPERIEITGSHIRQKVDDSATPVQVIGRKEIDDLGVNTIRQLVDSLASSTGGLSDLGGSNSFASGGTSASLRNLGKQSTLVLLNFRRVAPYALADYNEVFANLDSLPLAAVERVEILKNGGSAVYGSDAVAGVINIITRKDFKGLIVAADSARSLNSERFYEHTASVTGGFGNLETDRFNVLANIEFYKRQHVASWRPLLGDVNPEYAKLSPSFGTPSTYAYPGNVIGVGPVQGCATVVSGLCRYDRYERFEVQPGSERVNALLNGRFALGGGTELFAEGLYSKIKTSYSSAFPAYGYAIGPTVWGDPLTSGAKFFYPRGLPAEHPLNPTGEEVEFRYRFADAGSDNTVHSDNYRLLVGGRGSVGTWDWDSAIGVLGGTAKMVQRGPYSDSGFKEVIGDYNLDPLPADFFNKPNGYKIGQPNSEAVLNRLFPEVGFTGKGSQYFWDGKVSGPIAKLGGGDLSLALGFDLRHEKMSINPTANLASGDIVGYGTLDSNASRNFGAAFFELVAPLAKGLEVQAAARVDKFPGFGAHVSPRLSMKFAPSKAFALRATAETGFRAPNLTESAQSTKFAFNNGVTDPKRCDAAAALAADLQARADALPNSDPNKSLLLARADNVQQTECSAGVANVTLNNPTLKPETSMSYTLGMVFAPLTGLSASIDYWAIERKNEIGTKSVTDLLAVEDSLPAGTIIRDTLARDTTFTAAERAMYGVNAGPLLATRGMFYNLFKTRTSGIDLAAKYSTAVPIGRFSIDLDAVYLIDYREFSPDRGQYGDNLAGRYGYSRWTVRNTLGLQTGPVRQSLRIVWDSGYTLQRDYNDVNWTQAGCAARKLAAYCQVADYRRLDYSVAWDVTPNFELGLSIRNLLDQRPPVDMKDFGGTTGIIPPSREDARGPYYRLSLQYRF